MMTFQETVAGLSSPSAPLTSPPLRLPLPDNCQPLYILGVSQALGSQMAHNKCIKPVVDLSVTDRGLALPLV
ncbi:hypothetical protein EYF80_033507 [Liparis tanakae]|uniref:Uncharacterized protein n=1 Tax=Liparis tanakae TaxID=230148 RepID=A0A4Z2GSL7_9TELE|nr:hypothetical protein EYF80_033507 [Liparis tanakae]